MFSGTIRMKVCEAIGLRPTDFQKRHNMTFGKPDEQSIDPYISIDVDENHLGKSLGGRAIFPIHTVRLVYECECARESSKSVIYMYCIHKLMHSYTSLYPNFHEHIPMDVCVYSCVCVCHWHRYRRAVQCSKYAYPSRTHTSVYTHTHTQHEARENSLHFPPFRAGHFFLAALLQTTPSVCVVSICHLH